MVCCGGVGLIQERSRPDAVDCGIDDGDEMASGGEPLCEEDVCGNGVIEGGSLGGLERNCRPSDALRRQTKRRAAVQMGR